jgi:hypothetical protein
LSGQLSAVSGQLESGSTPKGSETKGRPISVRLKMMKLMAES